MCLISSSFGFSVMAKLPATSYVRMVDIWLIFTQLYPFLEVVLYTIIELYNEEEITNHHGFYRDIPDEQRKRVRGLFSMKFVYVYFQNKTIIVWPFSKETTLYNITKGIGKLHLPIM